MEKLDKYSDVIIKYFKNRERKVSIIDIFKRCLKRREQPRT